MKILSSQQQRQADQYTILNEPILSIDLMERAAQRCVDWISSIYHPKTCIHLFCGTGNNGGDGLAIARLLALKKYAVNCYIVRFTENSTKDFDLNLIRLQQTNIICKEIVLEKDMNAISIKEGILIDCLLGTGIIRPTANTLAYLIDKLNTLPLEKISIDVPSGLYCEQPNGVSDSVIRAKYTLTFQAPKLNFFFPENYAYVGEMVLLDIALDQKFIENMNCSWQTIERDTIQHFLKQRMKFSHKGSFGHATLFAGSTGKMGAAILSGRACLRSGVGLLTYVVPKNGNDILQTAVPEAMTIVLSSIDDLGGEFPTLPESIVGVGPGIGTSDKTTQFVLDLLRCSKQPIVIDADALNILSAHKNLLKYVPKNSVLTPHPKEFERLVGSFKNSHERLKKQLAFSKAHQCILLVKGAYTCITTPEGEVHFNTTGNPGMATGGSGDVLTGIILSLLAQSYTPHESALMGAYIHGMAGDLAAKKFGAASMIASDIVDFLSEALVTLRN